MNFFLAIFYVFVCVYLFIVRPIMRFFEQRAVIIHVNTALQEPPKPVEKIRVVAVPFDAEQKN